MKQPLKVIELFAGIGAPRKALTNLGIPHESIISEIDKHAINSYNAVHGQTENLGDVRKIEALPPCDLMTFGSPCQDISNAGLKRGLTEGSGTRSSLLWEVDRLLDCSPLPKILLFENVDAILQDKYKSHLNRYINSLADRGYTSSWKVLNAVDFGVAKPYVAICPEEGVYIPWTCSQADMLADDWEVVE